MQNYRNRDVNEMQNYGNRDVKVFTENTVKIIEKYSLLKRDGGDTVGKGICFIRIFLNVI